MLIYFTYSCENRMMNLWKMRINCLFLITLGLVISVNCLKLPNYITACSRSDPNLNECAVKNANDAISELVKGDKKYRIPALNPLVIPEILIDSNGQLRIQLNNVHVYGLKNTVVTHMDIDLKNQVLGASVSIPHLNIQADYDVKGRILVLPINGEGPANITAVNGVYTMHFKYSLFEKNGVKYGKIHDDSIEYHIKRAYFYLDNLFNGNKQLSEQMNQILDDNWNEVLKDLGPAITTAVSAIVKQIFTAVLDHVPYDEIFLP
ncbi:protein takeout-like [Chrysoperla carnea]|uniref:protein takeout-like n=1 Tax=Chrysoperla carnea TaxID=189513 RepID=UPI001D0880A2|nr:protein takeout-like [Chrysoperla carnea]